MTTLPLVVSHVPGTQILFATDGRNLALLFPSGNRLGFGATRGRHCDRGVDAMARTWTFSLRKEYRR